ncbi:unnamed protein product [Blepharisma stoltei]|uniref:Dickkopf N-terminal cysteine-rich domain-containing protein n=1 Tax=Blepharisma stoltei TaxID=1481888 RepID=A0AAU9K7Q0_9CILI|nr:unnamed protein product [Blepharisma stoltei]
MIYPMVKILAISFAFTLAIGSLLSHEDLLLPYGAISRIFPELVEPLKDIDTCSKYTCKTETQKFTSETCGYFNPEDQVIYSKPCKNSADTCFTTQLLSNRTCSNNPPVEISLPGDECSDLGNCYWDSSISCKKGRCQGDGLGKTCTSSLQCNPGASCQSIDGVMQCAPLIGIGETGCLEQYDCTYNGGCNISSTNDPTKNTCIKYGSLASGTEISEETCTVNSNVCSSTKCAKNNEGKFLCTGPIVSNGQIPVQCTYAYNSTAGCESKVDTSTGAEIYTICNCAWNKNGDSYCGLQPGDSPQAALLTEIQNWQNSAAIEKCHTYWRNPTFVNSKIQCAYEYYGSKPYSILLYRYIYAIMYVAAFNSEDCVLNTFFPYYLKAEENYNNGGNTDNASLVALATSFILISF